MYGLRSKGPKLIARDSVSGKMLKLDHLKWVVFDGLPRGMPLTGDPTCEVRAINCDADMASIDAENARMVEEDKARHQARKEQQAAARALREKNEAALAERKEAFRQAHMSQRQKQIEEAKAKALAERERLAARKIVGKPIEASHEHVIGAAMGDVPSMAVDEEQPAERKSRRERR